MQIDPRTNTLIITDLPAGSTPSRSCWHARSRRAAGRDRSAHHARRRATSPGRSACSGASTAACEPDGRQHDQPGVPEQRLARRPRRRRDRANTPSPTRAPTRRTTSAPGSSLPVPGATSAIGLALGAINGAFNLDVALSALERSGKGRILSTPRVTTQNNVEAEVTQGVQIPIQTEANNTVTVTFKDAALTLKVTPQITAANTVIMQITLENASPGLRPAGQRDPVDRHAARDHQVQVNDGVTTVIGGIFVSRETVDPRTGRRCCTASRSSAGSSSATTETDESRELLIFITPRIMRG